MSISKQSIGWNNITSSNKLNWMLNESTLFMNTCDFSFDAIWNGFNILDVNWLKGTVRVKRESLLFTHLQLHGKSNSIVVMCNIILKKGVVRLCISALLNGVMCAHCECTQRSALRTIGNLFTSTWLTIRRFLKWFFFLHSSRDGMMRLRKNLSDL